MFCWTGIYLTISMATTSVSIILTVWILKLHHPGPHQREMPAWLRSLILRHLARLVRFRCTVGCNDMRRRKKRHAESGGAGPTCVNHSGGDTTEACLRLINDMNKHSPVAELRAVGLIRRSGVATMPGFSNGPAGRSSAGDDDTRRTIVMEEILKNLKMLVQKKDANEQQAVVVNEWQEAASVMDRLLFAIFLTISLCSLLTLIVFIPYFRYVKENSE